MPSFSRSLEQSLHRALALANERHHEYATLEHLLLALLDDQDAAAVLRACNVDIEKLKRNLIEYIDGELDNLVMEADEILVAGEALSHCLLWTVRDMADSFGDDSFIKKVVLLSDCTSPVPGFEAMGQKLQDDLMSRRMQVTTSKDYLK